MPSVLAQGGRILTSQPLTDLPHALDDVTMFEAPWLTVRNVERVIDDESHLLDARWQLETINVGGAIDNPRDPCFLEVLHALEATDEQILAEVVVGDHR